MEKTTVFEIRAIFPEEDINRPKTIENREQRKLEPKKTKTNEEITTPDLSSGFKKTIGTVAAIYATMQTVINPIIREQVNKATVAGDFVQAAQIQRVQATVNNYVNLGLEAGVIVAAFVANPILGGVALVGSASKHIQQAISRNQRNRAIDGANNINTYINSYESARFVNVKAGR